MLRLIWRAAAGALAAVAIGAGPAAAAPVVLEDGHVDYGARMVDGQLQSQVKDGTRGPSAVVWREPADVVFHLRPAARTTVPANPQLAFLGAPGDPVWLIPQIQRSEILWAGWNTEELGAAELGGPVTWTLAAVDGPGAFAIFQTGSLGNADVLFNSRDGMPDTVNVPLGTHAHGNWAFSAAGTYRLTFTMSGTRPSGEAVSDTETLTVTVADAPPQGGGDPTPPPPGGGSPDPGNPTPSPGEPGRLTLRDMAATLRGRTLTLRLRLSAKSRIAVTVRRRGRTVARAKPRIVNTRTRRVRLRLNRRLKPGRYEVRVKATAGARTVTRATRLRVRATAAR